MVIFAIKFAPVTIKAFNKVHGFWSKYEKLKSDKISSLHVTPTLYLRRVGNFRDLRVDCAFDPADMPREKYGLAYGDQEFQTEINRHISSVLGVEGLNISYTEHGMQEDDLISMEGDKRNASFFEGVSNHTFLKWQGHPQVTRILRSAA